MEEPAVPVGPFHHRCHAEATIHEFAIFSCFCLHLLPVRACLIPARFRSFLLISAPTVQQCCTNKGMLYRMGTVIARRRKDGTTSYLAQITIKRKGEIAHREAQTFERKQAAKAWLARRETELAEPGALERPDNPTLLVAIDRYIADAERPLGSTKK